jgi:Mg-chelatase subunit ChlD
VGTAVALISRLAPLGRRLVAIADRTVLAIGYVLAAVGWLTRPAIAAVGSLLGALGALVVAVGGVIAGAGRVIAKALRAIAKAMPILTGPALASALIAGRVIARVAAGLSAETRPVLASIARAIGSAGATVGTGIALLIAPVGRSLFTLISPVQRVARRASARIRGSLGAEARVGARLRRPTVRVLLAVAMTALLGATPPGARGLAVVLWLAAVGYALPPVVRGLREIAARRIVPRFAYVGQRAAHSMRVAHMKAVVETSSSSCVTHLAAATTLPDSDDGDDRLRFQVSVHQNEYLAPAGTAVDAIITVAAGRAHSRNNRRNRSPERAEVILIDCSGSMAYPMRRLRAAQAATSAAIDALDDGTWFALVRANHAAAPLYPSRGLAQAAAATRAEAKQALEHLWPEGGTAMGNWLLLARDLLATRPGAIAHATLLTDGRNESETRAALDAALTACAGAFQCDCRGVGTDWEVGELRTIASTLLGTFDIVAQPADLEADFRSMARSAMSKLTGSVALRVWTPKGATLHALTQVSPSILDLSRRRTPTDELTGDYATGAWGEESRKYRASIQVPAKAIGDEMLAARVSLVVGGRPVEAALVKAIWTADAARSTQIDPEVAHYTGQAQMAHAIQDGLTAHRAGDESAASVKLGRAVQLATASHNYETMQLLAAVLDIDDPATGTVRVKRDVAHEDEMTLDTRSTKTVGAKPRT